MHLKRYEVVDMGEAIAQIKRDLGADAIIVSTRKLRKRSGLFGLVGQPCLEVIAAADSQNRQQSLPSTAVVPREVSSLRPQPTLAPLPSGYPLQTPSTATEIDSLRKELRIMRAKLLTFQEKANGQPKPRRKLRDLPRGLRKLHQQLINKGLAAELAGELIEEVSGSKPADAVQEETGLRENLKTAMIRKLCTLGPQPSPMVSSHLMAFVGAAGVGKTTTIAKLAAITALAAQKRVALITLDTYRIAATEQLKIYGKIIGTPVIVAMDREGLGKALRDTRHYDVVLIDTAGRCHRNAEQIWELKSMLSQPWPIEIHLVLDATTQEREAEEMIRQFSLLPLHSLSFAKLDESGSLGSLFNLAVRAAKPLSYLTTGQRVPEDFEVATPERIVDLFWHGFWRD